MTKNGLVTLLLLGMISLAGCSVAQDQAVRRIYAALPLGKDHKSDYELAKLYAPVFYFHPDEIYRPQPVDVILKHSQLRQSRRPWPDVNVLNQPTSLDLFTLESNDSYFLDEWFDDDGSSGSGNYTAHQTYYNEAGLNPKQGGPSPVVYAHVVRDENPNHIIIQYWALYFYNDWFNKHEGDWEMVEVVLTAASRPEWIVLSQHHGGTRRTWSSAQIEEGTHPVSYVARGSHANYFFGNEIYPNNKDVGNGKIEIVDRTGTFDRLIPNVTLIPDRDELKASPASWPGAEWIMYSGHWGEMTVQSDFSGPVGPADKGAQWEQPYAWGMDQPLDLDTWYKNRLQVEIVGAMPGESTVQLTDGHGNELPNAEGLGNLAILHTNPPASVVASINAVPYTHRDIAVTLPNTNAGQVIRLRFSDVQFADLGHVALELSPGDLTLLKVADTRASGRNLIPLVFALGPLPLILPSVGTISANRVALKPTVVETSEATWDTPDLVWMGDVLPVDQLGLGIIMALMYSLVPTLAFVGVLNWVNLYNKGPLSMFATAFIWGAIPALTVALVVELFFRLPPNVIGPDSLDALRIGLLAPILEEMIKAVGVVFVYRRHRGKFVDVLDGMIYGAIVGFGFAMTANLLRYIGNFMLWGYPGLSEAVIVERTINAMDHGLYTAIFGMGLGIARLVRKNRQRSMVLAGALGLAIFTHTMHNLLAHSLVGLNALTVIVTCAGTLVLWAVAGWSLLQQRRCLQTELKDVVPEWLYHTVLQPLACTRAQLRSLRQEGIGGWRRTRRMHHLCADMAHQRKRARLFPDEPERAAEAEASRKEIIALVGFERTAQYE